MTFWGKKSLTSMIPKYSNTVLYDNTDTLKYSNTAITSPNPHHQTLGKFALYGTIPCYLRI